MDHLLPCAKFPRARVTRTYGTLVQNQSMHTVGEVAKCSLTHGRSCADPCVKANLRSQWGEDITMLPDLLAAAAATTGTSGGHGTFVELGAYDGETYSNTWLLERCFGWRGLLIEANPSNFKKLCISGRKAALKVHSAVCERDGQVAMFAEGGPGAGSAKVSTPFEQRLRHNLANTTVEVPCKPLRSLMADAGLQTATFLSLDVEGAEETVLRTVDPAAFAMIMIETATNEAAISSGVERFGLMEKYRLLWIRKHGKDMSPWGGRSQVWIRKDLNWTGSWASQPWRNVAQQRR